MSKTTQPLTISVPDAGARYFNLSRNASYDAAARGDIPTVKIGRLLRVPVQALDRMVGMSGQPSDVKMGDDQVKKPRGRKPKLINGERASSIFSMRITSSLRQAIERAAADNECSITDVVDTVLRRGLNVTENKPSLHQYLDGLLTGHNRANGS